MTEPKAYPEVIVLQAYGRRQYSDVALLLWALDCAERLSLEGGAESQLEAQAIQDRIHDIRQILADPRNQPDGKKPGEKPTLKGAGIYGEQPNVPRPHPSECQHLRGFTVVGEDSAECPICGHAIGF